MAAFPSSSGFLIAIISLKITVAEPIIPPLAVDIMEARAAANTNPLTPPGQKVVAAVANARFVFSRLGTAAAIHIPIITVAIAYMNI